MSLKETPKSQHQSCSSLQREVPCYSHHISIQKLRRQKTSRGCYWEDHLLPFTHGVKLQGTLLTHHLEIPLRTPATRSTWHNNDTCIKQKLSTESNPRSYFPYSDQWQWPTIQFHLYRDCEAYRVLYSTFTLFAHLDHNTVYWVPKKTELISVF